MQIVRALLRHLWRAFRCRSGRSASDIASISVQDPRAQQHADLNVGLYLNAQFLEVLYYGTVDCTTKIGMLVRNDTSFVADAVIDILRGRARISRRWSIHHLVDFRGQRT